MFIVIILAFLFTEIRYLIRHPWTFNWTATLVWAVITTTSIVFILKERAITFATLACGAAIMVYYYLKINLNRRRPKVMQLHHQHYYRKTHTHKK
jgi:hypothetical protein